MTRHIHYHNIHLLSNHEVFYGWHECWMAQAARFVLALMLNEARNMYNGHHSILEAFFCHV